MRPGLHAAAMSDASLSSREPLLSQLATSDDALRRAHNARPGSPRTEKDDQGPYSGNTSPTYTGSAPWTPVEARNSSLAASRRSSWWPSSARAAGYARPGSPLTSRLPSRASFRLLLSSKRTLALLAAVVLLALLGSASSQASSSATSEPHYRLPASRFNPATWRAPFSFSWGDSRTGSATCTPHAPQDLAERFDRASRPLDVKATTSQRLDDWEFEAPGWGVEPADWVRRNVQVRPVRRDVRHGSRLLGLTVSRNPRSHSTLAPFYRCRSLFRTLPPHRTTSPPAPDPRSHARRTASSRTRTSSSSTTRISSGRPSTRRELWDSGAR